MKTKTCNAGVWFSFIKDATVSLRRWGEVGWGVGGWEVNQLKLRARTFQIS